MELFITSLTWGSNESSLGLSSAVQSHHWGPKLFLCLLSKIIFMLGFISGLFTSRLQCGCHSSRHHILRGQAGREGCTSRNGRKGPAATIFLKEKNLSQTALTPAIESPLLAWKWSHAHCRPVTDKKMELPWFSDIMSHSEQNWGSASWGERENDCSVHAQQYLPHASTTDKLYWPLTENCSN